MANPFTSAQAPSQQQPNVAMQLIAPELIADQLRLARQQQMAQILKERGLKEAGDTQVIGGWAVKQQPVEGLSRLASLLGGTYLQNQADGKNSEIQKLFAQKLQQEATGGSAPTNTAMGGNEVVPLPMSGGSPVNAPMPAGSSIVGQQSGGDVYNMANGRRGLAIDTLFGHEAGKNFWDDRAKTEAGKRDTELGIDSVTARQLSMAERLKAGTQTFAPGQSYQIPGQPMMAAPDFNNGIAGAFDAQGKPVLNAIPNANQILSDRTTATADAQEGAKLQTITDPDGTTRMGRTREMLPTAPVNGVQPGASQTYGTPPLLLDNLVAIESGGNPKAVNAQSGAQGLGQFLPATVKMLKDKGYEFDPFDKKQSRQAMDYYVSDLVKQNGGDVRKALADYGGFKTKDPTSYVDRALKGVDTSQYGKAAQNNAAPVEQAGTVVQSPAGAAQQKKTFENMAEFETNLNNKVAKSSEMMKRLQVTEEALRQLKPGGGTELRAKIAEKLQALGLPQSAVDKVAGGDLGAMQVVNKTALTEALLAMQSALSSDTGAQQKGNQMIMEKFLSANPDLDKDPRAWEKLLNMQKQFHTDVMGESNSYYDYKKEHKGDTSAFQNYYANKSMASGRVIANQTNNAPYASKAGKTPPNIQQLLDKYK